MTKLCLGCGLALSLSEFYVNKLMTSGRLNKCKACVKRQALNHRMRNLDAIREYDRQRGKLEKRRARSREYARTHPEICSAAKLNWELRNPHKKRAVIAANNAKRDGRLVKLPCEVCGDLRAEGHHDDYSKTLEVRWLCDTHHKAHHNAIREAQRAA